MNDPIVSVCIPTYNRGKWIGETITSVLSQSFTDYELLIIDNQSEDNTAEVVASFNDARIRFLTNDWNIGEYKNMNRCAIKARGKYIKFLHSDDVFITNDALSRMMEIAVSYPQAAIITCGFRKQDGMDFILPMDLYRQKGFQAVREVMNIHSFGLPSEWLIRRDALFYSGLANDITTADVDLAMRLVYYFDSYTISEAFVEHRFYEDNGSLHASKSNAWEHIRLTALGQLPFSKQLNGGQKATLSSFLHMLKMVYIEKFVEMEMYHFSLQGVLDLLKADPHLYCFFGEDRERVLNQLLNMLVYRRTPDEIRDYMIEQTYSKPYADFFRYGIAFNYQIYHLIPKLKGTNKKIRVIGSDKLARSFVEAFRDLRPFIDHIVIFNQQTNEGTKEIDGIAVQHNLRNDMNDYFNIIASGELIRHHRYELLSAGYVEGEIFLPMIELL